MLTLKRGFNIRTALVIVALMTGSEAASGLGWDDLWLRSDQQAAQALAEGDTNQAVELADDPMRRGVAHYRNGDFDQAASAFSAAGGADATYNLGNALTELGRYQEAVEAYNQALAADPTMEDAQFNRDVARHLLEKQQSENEPADQSQPQNSPSQENNTEQQQNSSSSDG